MPLNWIRLFLVFAALTALAAPRADLEVGTAGHVFDHLGNLGEQADAAVASGGNIIYATGVGGLGYLGLPNAEQMTSQLAAARNYIQGARRKGVRLALGYVCATSIVKLDQFDRNWATEFRNQFHTPVASWRQQGSDGKFLVSWYGGEYQPACMNNPDWRTYEKRIVRWQLEAGCDGIFFDNPTVHPQGCYCPDCMKAFGQFLDQGHITNLVDRAVPVMRRFAAEHPREFMQFRATIARDFLAEIRTFARTIKRNALVTANNSLNSKEVLYSQCRTYGYSIYEMSRAEDLVVVEDMSSQPRVLNGQAVEYGPTYRQLFAISHGKPVVAVCLADADYHTPANLVRLAMAEAAANSASHLWWPTWPEAERQRMAQIISPQAKFLRDHAALLNQTTIRNDAVLWLPMRNFLDRGIAPPHKSRRISRAPTCSTR